MKIIKNSKELAKLVDENKNLCLEGENVRIEFEPKRAELRDVYCRDLFLGDDNNKYDFNGRDFDGENFNGWNFNGGNFNGENFNGGNFNGENFNGENFNGWDFNGGSFNGKKVSYYAFFNCYGSIKCTSIEGRRDPHAEPVCLDGELEIVPEEESQDEMIDIDGVKLSKQTIKKHFRGLFK